MKINTPSWFELFRRNYIENYILLVIQSYRDISDKSKALLKKEEQRRTELVNIMRKKKGDFNINFPIAYESGEKTKRMDICCYIDNLKEDQYICFECKRFLKSNINNYNFEMEYYGQGIKRFEDGEYSQCMPQAGMIVFLESGDMNKLKELMLKKLPEKASKNQFEDCSLYYRFCYVYRTVHMRAVVGNGLSLHHILLDLTPRKNK
ncbi:MAG: hypothetical protein PHV18_04160 [Lachnospiraceae bacterium]|nr:hypothetical protein [Lachnospiraceae bacterium]